MRETFRRAVINWREALPMIPKGFGEREDHTRSQRWPQDLAKRVEKIAAETQQDFTTALFHLVKWACDEYDQQRAAEKKGKAS
jgi:hypothetical protein